MKLPCGLVTSSDDADDDDDDDDDDDKAGWFAEYKDAAGGEKDVVESVRTCCTLRRMRARSSGDSRCGLSVSNVSG